MAENGTNEPGNCCPIYTCDGCLDDERIDGACPCAMNATLNARGICECVNPTESLSENNTCICDPNKCNLPELCDKRSVALRVQDGCCQKVNCKKCPDDSYPTAYRDDAVEDKCVCYPCKQHQCADGMRAVVKQRGKGLWGLADCFYTDNEILL